MCVDFVGDLYNLDCSKKKNAKDFNKGNVESLQQKIGNNRNKGRERESVQEKEERNNHHIMYTLLAKRLATENKESASAQNYVYKTDTMLLLL